MPFTEDARDREPAGTYDGAGLAERLTEILPGLNTDELRLVVLVAERLAKGRRHYGPMNLATDRRNFTGEAVEELVDAAAYLAMQLLRAGA